MRAHGRGFDSSAVRMSTLDCAAIEGAPRGEARCGVPSESHPFRQIQENAREAGVRVSGPVDDSTVYATHR